VPATFVGDDSDEKSDSPSRRVGTLSLLREYPTERPSEAPAVSSLLNFVGHVFNVSGFIEYEHDEIVLHMFFNRQQGVCRRSMGFHPVPSDLWFVVV